MIRKRLIIHFSNQISDFGLDQRSEDSEDPVSRRYGPPGQLFLWFQILSISAQLSTGCRPSSARRSSVSNFQNSKPNKAIKVYIPPILTNLNSSEGTYENVSRDHGRCTILTGWENNWRQRSTDRTVRCQFDPSPSWVIWTSDLKLVRYLG